MNAPRLETRVGVIGAGAWGTALAVVLNRGGNRVRLWSRNATALASIQERRMNDPYLPGIYIDPSIEVTSDLHAACDADAVVLTVPSQSFRSLAITLSDLLDGRTPLVIASKGIERGSLMMLSEIIAEMLPENPVAVLSGPNFADEAARGLPTATTIACAEPTVADFLLYCFGGKWFRPYVSYDVVGTQIGGAIKNVIAIASGIVSGRGLGENARAGLITRGLAEMSRLCIAKGGKAETLMGLSGIGDLMLSCTSAKSRNYALGMRIGQGKPFRQSVSSQRHEGGLTEGVFTAESVTQLAQKLGIAMPITTAVQRILKEEISVESAVEELLERPLVAESVAFA